MSTSPYNPTVAKRWRDKNKAKIKRMQREWQAAHPSYFKDYASKNKKKARGKRPPTARPALCTPRQIAKHNGAVTYHGRACKKGHTEKYTQSSVCVQCNELTTKTKRQQIRVSRPLSHQELEQRQIDDYLARNPEPTSFGPAYGRNSF